MKKLLKLIHDKIFKVTVTINQNGIKVTTRFKPNRTFSIKNGIMQTPYIKTNNINYDQLIMLPNEIKLDSINN